MEKGMTRYALITGASSGIGWPGGLARPAAPQAVLVAAGVISWRNVQLN